MLFYHDDNEDFIEDIDWNCVIWKYDDVVLVVVGWLTKMAHYYQECNWYAINESIQLTYILHK